MYLILKNKNVNYYHFYKNLKFFSGSLKIFGVSQNYFLLFEKSSKNIDFLALKHLILETERRLRIQVKLWRSLGWKHLEDVMHFSDCLWNFVFFQYKVQISQLFSNDGFCRMPKSHSVINLCRYKQVFPAGWRPTGQPVAGRHCHQWLRMVYLRLQPSTRHRRESAVAAFRSFRGCAVSKGHSRSPD